MTISSTNTLKPSQVSEALGVLVGIKRRGAMALKTAIDALSRALRRSDTGALLKPCAFVQKCTLSLLTIVQFYANMQVMKGAEFIRKITRTGRRNNIPVRFAKEQGKGSHGTLYYGDRPTIVKDRTKEIGHGLLTKMLRDLGLTRDDLK